MRVTTGLLFGVSLLLPTAAGATAPHFIIDSWGDEGSGPGEFDMAQDLDVDGQGNVYVLDDQRDERIQKFDQEGRLILSYDGDGQLDGPEAIAATPAGDLWVIDFFARVVVKFDPYGNRWFTRDIPDSPDGIHTTPVAISLGPDESVSILDNFGKGVHRFNSSGDYQGYWSIHSTTGLLADLAVDATGDTLVLALSKMVYRFSSSGALRSAWPVTMANGTTVGEVRALDVSDKGEVYVLSQEPGAEAVYRYTSGGRFLSRSSLTAVDPAGPRKLAVDWTDNLWVSDAGAPAVIRLAPPPAATHILQSASVPGYLFEVRIGQGPGRAIYGSKEGDCIPETLCVSGAVPGRSEAFLRVVGPKPNGKMWPTLVKFSTSTIEVWVQQVSTGRLRYYRLPGASPGVDELPGMFDRLGYDP